jgi:hypothetical protein
VRRTALALAALAALAGAPARAREASRSRQVRVASAPPAATPIRHGPGVGAVVHVTSRRAYLDVGAAEGLATGQIVRLVRREAPVGTCEVEVVAVHRATCLGADARRGDTFRITPRPAPAPPKPLPPLVDAEELDRRAQVVAAQPVLKVEARAKAADPVEAPGPRRAEVVLSHAVWSSSGFSAWQQERVDAAVRGVETFGGLRLWADLRAVHWTVHPDTAHDLPGQQSRLYVWEAALATRDPSRPYTLAFGRVMPWGIPGATVMDGVQVGLSPSGRRGEVGLFGGFVPDPATLDPTRDRSTVGAYGSLELGSGFLVGREEVRAAVSTSPELGTRFEGQLRSFLLLGRSVNASCDLRIGLGGLHQAPAGIDAAQVDLGGRPYPSILVSGLFRYVGLLIPDVPPPAPALYPAPERRWDAAAGYELGPTVISVAGGYGVDLSTGLERSWAGPELSFPRLFGAHGGAMVGYAEERGWISGWSAWVQAFVRPAPAFQLTGRITYTVDTRTGADDDLALGLSLTASADLARWLSLRVSVLARAGALGTWGDYARSGVAARAGIELRP